ncbi:MAG: hypothetical protein ACOC7J_06260 [Armatimonadota bacterium]
MRANGGLTPPAPLSLDTANGAVSSGRGGRTAAVLALLLLAIVAHAEPFAFDFSDPAALEAVTLDGRQSARTEEGHVLLRGGSSMYVTQATGPGVYHMRFSMIEAEKFQYHVPGLELFKADAADPASDGYAINWQPWGMITLTAMIDGERVYSREFIHPGRDNPNRYESGEPVDMTLRVPPEGDCVEVYAHRTEAEGEPTCRFKLLEEMPLEGHFGWRNTKWYSHAAIHQLSFQPAE